MSVRPENLERFRITQGAVALGIPFEAYRQHVEAGQKWCSGCRAWHRWQAFGARASRLDGLDIECREHRNARSRAAMRRLYWQRKAAAS